VARKARRKSAAALDATGLLEAEKKFPRIKGYQEILLLKERLNPARIQQKEFRTVEVPCPVSFSVARNERPD
jgi:hypothetical protein